MWGSRPLPDRRLQKGDGLQGTDMTETDQRTGYLRPRDAAALVLIDRTGNVPRVLLGKRSSRHVFLPDTYVFPGGKCDPTDHALPYSADLNPDVLSKLQAGPPARLSASRARALALAALRELREETGLHPSQAPDLSCLRLAVRAITPPGHVRRYDTRFFVAFTDESGIDPRTARESNELHDLRWLDIQSDPCLNMPGITRSVYADVRTLLAKRTSQSLSDPAFNNPVPFYRMLRGRALRSFL